MSPAVQEMRRLPAETPAEEVSAALRTEGYAYLPGFLAPDAVAPLTQAVRRALGEDGGSGTASSRFAELYSRIQSLEVLHRTAGHPALTGLVGALLGEQVFRHPAVALRVSTPRPGPWVTRPHQDFVALQVCVDVLTCWVALTPCSEDRRGLWVRRRSHLAGYIPPDPAVPGARPLYVGPAHAADQAQDWVTADFLPGDVVVFHSLTIHAGGANTSDTVRLSFDCRFQSVREPILADHIHPHGWPAVPDWDALTAGWATPWRPGLPREVQVLPPTAGRFADTLLGLRPPRSLFLSGDRSALNERITQQ